MHRLEGRAGHSFSGRRSLEKRRSVNLYRVPPLACARKARDVTSCYFLRFRHVANVGVAGSSPVSCSNFDRSGRGLRIQPLGRFCVWGHCGVTCECESREQVGRNFIRK